MARNTEFTINVDSNIGTRIKELRLIQGLSRDQLGKKIFVSHQQLQKYENATNRVSAGKLLLIAKSLGVDIQYFFEGIECDDTILPTHHQKMSMVVSRNFMRIINPEVQTLVNSLVAGLAKVK